VSPKKTGSGLGARMAAAPPVSAVAAGFAAATGSEPAAKAEVVALNVRLPKDLHRTLRQLAFEGETSINALLVQAAEEWLAKAK
jgi:predicted HicB family RNase H-like nuclease